MKVESPGRNLVHERRRADRAVKLFYLDDEDRFVLEISRRAHVHEEYFRSGEKAEAAFRRVASELDLM